MLGLCQSVRVRVRVRVRACAISMPMLLPDGLESTSGLLRRGRVTGFLQSKWGRPETGELQPPGAQHTPDGLD